MRTGQQVTEGRAERRRIGREMEKGPTPKEWASYRRWLRRHPNVVHWPVDVDKLERESDAAQLRMRK